LHVALANPRRKWGIACVQERVADQQFLAGAQGAGVGRITRALNRLLTLPLGLLASIIINKPLSEKATPRPDWRVVCKTLRRRPSFKSQLPSLEGLFLAPRNKLVRRWNDLVGPENTVWHKQQ
jgi:hypothetical protein